MTDDVPPLVSTDWLAQRLGRPGLAVADASYHLPHTGRDGRAEFLTARVGVSPDLSTSGGTSDGRFLILSRSSR